MEYNKNYYVYYKIKKTNEFMVYSNVTKKITKLPYVEFTKLKHTFVVWGVNDKASKKNLRMYAKI